jgi:hypothetical protein
VSFRLGNHDLELALPAVQQVIRSALGQPVAVSNRLCFVTGERPLLVEIGGTRVLITHGEHDDPWNRIDYPQLLAYADGAAAATAFRYPAGSQLVRRIIAPLRQHYGLRSLDYLKPDFQGAALVALAVAPAACRQLFQLATWDIGWQLLRSRHAGVAFDQPLSDEPELGLADRLAGCELSAAEQAELEEVCGVGESGVSFAASELSERARSKLVRSGLALYAGAHRAAAGQAGTAFFSLDPAPAEREWAAELGRRHAADVVLTGHSHAARFHCDGQHAYVNSGTWTWLVRLPPPTATVEAWCDWLHELEQNPTLDEAQQRLVRKERLLTVITAAAEPTSGLRLTLSECQEDGQLRELRAGVLPPSIPIPTRDKGVDHGEPPPR